MSGSWAAITIDAESVELGDEVLVNRKWLTIGYVKGNTFYVMDGEGNESLVDLRDVDGAQRWELDAPLTEIEQDLQEAEEYNQLIEDGT